MTAGAAAVSGRDRLARVVVTLWTFAVLSPRLHHSATENLQWYATAAALPLLLLLRPPRAAPSHLLGRLTPAVLLVAAMLLGSFVGDEPLRSTVHSVKTAVVWLALAPLLLLEPRLARSALHAALAAVLLNAGLLAAGALGFESLAAATGNGRWGTALNGPGYLARLGGFGFCYAAPALLASPRRRDLSLAAASLALIAFDGSRSALLGVAVALPAALWAARSGPRTGTRRALPVRTLAAGVGFAAVFALLWHAPRLGFTEMVAGERLRAALATPTSLSLRGYLESVDKARFGALLASLEAIRENPLVGGGLGSTRAPGSETDITVHNAYLQAWADLGLIGFLPYCWLTLSWIPALPGYLARARRLESATARREYFGSAAALAFFAFWGLFQGVGVDPSAWIFFVPPWVYFVRLRGYKPPRQIRPSLDSSVTRCGHATPAAAR